MLYPLLLKIWEQEKVPESWKIMTSRKTPKERRSLFLQQLEGDHAAFDPWKGPGKNHPG